MKSHIERVITVTLELDDAEARKLSEVLRQYRSMAQIGPLADFASELNDHVEF